MSEEQPQEKPVSRWKTDAEYREKRRASSRRYYETKGKLNKQKKYQDYKETKKIDDAIEFLKTKGYNITKNE